MDEIWHKNMLEALIKNSVFARMKNNNDNIFYS